MSGNAVALYAIKGNMRRVAQWDLAETLAAWVGGVGVFFRWLRPVGLFYPKV